MFKKIIRALQGKRDNKMITDLANVAILNNNVRDMRQEAYDAGYAAYGERKSIDDTPDTYCMVEVINFRIGWIDHERMSKEAGGPFPIFDEAVS